jgi:hypothetical protein
MFRDPRPFPEELPILPARPPQPPRRFTRRQVVVVLILGLLLLSGIIGGWSAAVLHSFAANAPVKTTLPQFLAQQHPYHPSQGPHVLPKGPEALPFWNKALAKYAPASVHALPSAEPAGMKPVSQGLAASSGTALHLVGSDANGARLEVLIPAGALDLSHATISGGASPQGTLTLTLSQVRGHFAGTTNVLGAFQVQVTDAQGQIVHGIRLRAPVTFLYHVRPGELAALDLDPSRLVLSWPDLIAANTAARQPTSGDVVPMQSDATASTLSAQSNVLDSGTLAVGASVPINQTPPKPLLASVLGNSGQLSYSYPLVVAPGPLGTVPDLALSYTSGDPNGRHSWYSPAAPTGDGWSLTLGAITADPTFSGTTWYSLSGVDGISDRLIPDSSGNNFTTEHLSYLKITKVTVNSQPCFHVWDTDGNYYEFGCTTDSLQYDTNSSGTRTNYRWDLDKVIPANEGPTAASRTMTVSYVHDTTTGGGHTTIRDSAIKQIVYGGSQPAGTVDFFYKGPTAYTDGNGVQWITAYGKNEGGCTPPDGLSTTERCDDPADRSGGLQNPLVMSTLTLETVKSYVGTDSSASHLDYSYSFSYQDTPFVDCTDSVSLSPAYCAGEHLLTGITPTVYQNGTGHQLPGITFSYTSTRQNSYSDTTQTVGGNAFHAVTNWSYLQSYFDLASGVGATIQYHTAWNNSNGTPLNSDGDNRYDALFCDWHPSLCTQAPFAPMDQKMWTVQVVTSITSSGQDSSSSSLAPDTTSYDY